MSVSARRDQGSGRKAGAPGCLRVGAASLLASAGAILACIVLQVSLDTVASVVWLDALLLGAVSALGGYTAIALVRAARKVDQAGSDARAYRKRLETLVEEMPIGVAVIESETGHALLNDRYRQLLRLDPNMTGAEFPVPGVRVYDREGIALPMSRLPGYRAMKAGETLRGEELRVEWPDGTTQWLSVGAAPIRNEEEEIAAMVVSVVDISQTKAEEAEGNRLLTTILKAQEDERLRIAREFHDELGQKLTALSISLKCLEANGAVAEPAVTRVHDSRKLVDELFHTVRHITSRLRPLQLEDLGLPITAEEMVLAWGQQMGIAVDMHIDELPGELSSDTGIVAYRVIQESLTNVARHAAASNVSVTLHRDGPHLRIAIEDDGVGFDRASTAAPGARHFGLFGIEERVRSVGGCLDIESEPGVGTAVFVSLPLRKE